MLPRPQVDVNCIQESKQGEAPRDAIDDDPLPNCGELVDNGSEKKEVNESPVRRMKGWRRRKGEQTHQIKKAQGAGVIYVSLPE